jgi:hypothetical protein
VAFPSAFFVSDRTTVLMITLPIPLKPPRLLFYNEVGGSGTGPADLVVCLVSPRS